MSILIILLFKRFIDFYLNQQKRNELEKTLKILEDIYFSSPKEKLAFLRKLADASSPEFVRFIKQEGLDYFSPLILLKDFFRKISNFQKEQDFLVSYFFKKILIATLLSNILVCFFSQNLTNLFQPEPQLLASFAMIAFYFLLRVLTRPKNKVEWFDTWFMFYTSTSQRYAQALKLMPLGIRQSISADLKTQTILGVDLRQNIRQKLKLFLNEQLLDLKNFSKKLNDFLPVAELLGLGLPVIVLLSPLLTSLLEG